MDVAFAGLVQALPWTGAAVLFVAVVTLVIGVRIGRHSVADTAWGLLFVAVSSAATITSYGYGEPARRWLLFGMVAVWGARLAIHTGRRSRGGGEDPRYVELLDRGSGPRTLRAVALIYLPQAALAFVISAPLQVGAFERGDIGILAFAGVLLWAVGLFFETVGDAQMQRYKTWKKAQPSDAVQGSVMDKGLWRYTRHPNYFGDACVWWGIYLVVAEHWVGALTIAAPALMTYLLVFGSGMKNLERGMVRRPGYPEYMARTSGFFPLPPKRRPEGPAARQPDAADVSLIKR